MGSPLNLVTLPPDVIRIIIRMADESAEELRLISRAWDALCSRHIATRPRFPLERVYLFAFVPEDKYYHLDKEIDEETLRLNKEAEERVHMYSIMEKRFSNQAGVGKWLTKHKVYDTSTIEIKSEPVRISSSSHLANVSVMVMICCFISFPLLLLTILLYEVLPQIVGIALSLAVLALLIFVWRRGWEHVDKYEEKERKAHSRFSRFFSNISRIDTLILDHVESTRGYHQGTAMGTLGHETKITQLVIQTDTCTEQLQRELLDWCRKHGIRHVFISSLNCKMANFGNFVKELVKIGVTRVDFYERSKTEPTHLFLQVQTVVEQACSQPGQGANRDGN